MSVNKASRSKRAPHAEKPVHDENNPVVKCFVEFARELDEKHDRNERIVKLSRDITIESKRIIFQLHTIDECKGNKARVLEEVKARLEKVCQTQFQAIAVELRGRDPYQFTRAYSAGLQEFVEAFTFYELCSGISLSGWEGITGTLLKYTDPDLGEFDCLLPPIEYMMGLLDTTGEMMRKCVQSLGSGDVETCFGTCRQLQQIYSGFLSVGPTYNDRYWSRKLTVLKQSLQKSEMVCYNVKVRGKEAAIWANNAAPKADFSDDEGIY